MVQLCGARDAADLQVKISNAEREAARYLNILIAGNTLADDQAARRTVLMELDAAIERLRAKSNALEATSPIPRISAMTATGSEAKHPWMAIAEAELGVREIAGPRAQERILGYWRICGHEHQSSDEVPWCAIFVGACLVQTGYRTTKSAMARSYLNYGQKLDGPAVGAIAVLARGTPPSGHVAFVAGFTATHLLLLGGNQGDAVQSKWFSRKDVIGYRMPTKLERLELPPPVTPPNPKLRAG